MRRVEVRYETGEWSHIVGRLLDLDGRIFFQYDEDFRQLGIALSPFHLPVSIAEPVEEKERTYHGLHGLFNDSLPDGWGMIVMERALSQRGIDPLSITPLDRLLFLGSRTMGALTYHPPSEPDDDRRLELDLTEIAEQSHRILEGSTEKILPELVRAGGSPMGARPKVVAGVRDDFGHLVTGNADLPAGYSHWLIKFAAGNDSVDAGSIEMAYSQMARSAGLSVPPTHLFSVSEGRACFGAQRFDRDPAASSRRHHVHTFAGLIHHDHRHVGQDYNDLLKVTRLLTRNHQDVVEAFRRMVFNILAHNRDDHTKNFAFRMSPDGEWSLTPAYDITYSGGPGGEHTLLVNGEGRVPTRAHAEAVAARASIEPRESREVISQVEEAVADWPAFAKAQGVSNDSIQEIRKRMASVYASFIDQSARTLAEATDASRSRVARRRRSSP